MRSSCSPIIRTLQQQTTLQCICLSAWQRARHRVKASSKGLKVMPVQMVCHARASDYLSAWQRTKARAWTAKKRIGCAHLRGLEMATLSLLGSVTKPSFPSRLHLTVDITITSASRPYMTHRISPANLTREGPASRPMSLKPHLMLRGR